MKLLVLNTWSLFSLSLLFFGCGNESSDRQKVLRVGTSGDYAPFSSNTSGELEGFDIELAKRFSADQGMELKFVIFKWSNLLADLEANKFDVAMGGVTVRPDRSLAARFTVPTTTSGAVVIVPNGSSETMESLDRKRIRIGVNQGGHLERVTRDKFEKATIITSDENQAIPVMLLAGEIDALVTDTMEAPFWLERLPGARALAPFTQDRKAWLVHSDEVELGNRLDAWLLSQEEAGSLAELRSEFLPAGNDEYTASPLLALLAAMDERLSLMPAVAESKRLLGKPVEDVAQEERVLETATLGVLEEALRQGFKPPEEDSVAAFFRAQIEAAKAIQYATLGSPATMSNPLDLVQDLRPALGRISEKINRLLLVANIENREILNSLVYQAFARHQIAEHHVASIEESLWVLFCDLNHNLDP